MGNACYIDEHFSDIIQTREYRSPEVILGIVYDTSADMWSLACMVFELVTGDYLFNPKKGKDFPKNEDHLAQIQELIGECSNKKWLLSGDDSAKFLDKSTGKLKHIKKFEYWSLRQVLIEKYKMRENEAFALADFLGKMLRWEMKDRASAQKMLGHFWLKMLPNYDTKMSRDEWKLYAGARGLSISDTISEETEGESDEDDDDSSSDGSSSSEEHSQDRKRSKGNDGSDDEGNSDDSDDSD